ncbi:hypothetical protein [Brevundimonas sp.]|jgi:hypothetical protein|uniref:hypothetical protein n=1 Tax=Brevundimonas sp. TaxID=1871086 RepID=UPI003784406D
MADDEEPEPWWFPEARVEMARNAGRRPAPDDVWAMVRIDYLNGLSARDCCARHGVGRTALRNRAQIEGWRRTDQPWVWKAGLEIDDEGVELDHQLDGDIDQIDHEQFIDIVRRRMKRALLHGDAASALRWRRVAKQVSEEFYKMECEDRWAAREALKSRSPDSADSTDSPDSNFESGLISRS